MPFHKNEVPIWGGGGVISYYGYMNVIIALFYFHIRVMSCFTAKPYRSQEEMDEALTSRAMNAMGYTLAGIAFDDSNPFPDNIQVRKSAVKHYHHHSHHVWHWVMCGLLSVFLPPLQWSS